ncbi:MAG: MarR family transcriptional regulator [Pseudomonadota bacterium]
MKSAQPAKKSKSTDVSTKTARGRAKPAEAENWDARLGFLMHDVSRLRRSVFDEFMKPMAMTRSQWWILAHLSRHDGMIQSDLANVLDIGKAALGGLIDRLEASTFIERRTDDNDRRVKRIYLTSKGTQIIAEMRTRSHDVSERILEGLDTASRNALVDMLALVKKNLLSIKGDSPAE